MFAMCSVQRAIPPTPLVSFNFKTTGNMSDDLLLIALLALPFVGSIIAALLPVNARNAEAWLAGAVALAALLIAAQFYPDVARAEVIQLPLEWLPALGLNFILRLDGFSWMFSVLVTGIGCGRISGELHVDADPVRASFIFPVMARVGWALGK